MSNSRVTTSDLIVITAILWRKKKNRKKPTIFPVDSSVVQLTSLHLLDTHRQCVRTRYFECDTLSFTLRWMFRLPYNVCVYALFELQTHTELWALSWMARQPECVHVNCEWMWSAWIKCSRAVSSSCVVSLYDASAWTSVWHVFLVVNGDVSALYGVDGRTCVPKPESAHFALCIDAKTTKRSVFARHFSESWKLFHCIQPTKTMKNDEWVRRISASHNLYIAMRHICFRCAS